MTWTDQVLSGQATPSAPRRLVVVSHVIHFRHRGRLHAYAAYAREIDRWADLFPELVIAAPIRDSAPDSDCAPFERTNIGVAPQPEMGGTSWTAKISQAVCTPYLAARLWWTVRGAPAIHVRCPGNLGLVGALVAPLTGAKLVAKYAGNWTGYPEEPWSLRFQRALLRSRWWRGPVTVYGAWPDQPPHVIPFFTSVMTASQVAHAARIAGQRRIGSSLRVLYVGRLARNKNVDVLLRALRRVRERGIPVQTTVVGDGPVRGELAKLTTAEGLDDAVRFTGALAFDEVQRWYEWADVLVLASDAEGWPKAIAEAMSFGVVCLGSARGFIPRMLEDGRGVLVQPGDVEGLATALAAVAGEPERHLAIGRRAADWARRYSLEGLADALRALLTEQWQVQFPPMPPATSTVSESPPGSPLAGFPNPVASPRSRLPERAP